MLDGLVGRVDPDLGSAFIAADIHGDLLFVAQSFEQLSQYTASVRPRYLMLLSVMLVQTVQPHSVQQMSMAVSLLRRKSQ